MMNCIPCILIQGHQVASGLGGDPRFPQGTLAEQLRHFAQLGLDLSPYYLGTLNLLIAPYQYRILKSTYTFQNVRWSAIVPPEDFSFFACQLHQISRLDSVSIDLNKTDLIYADQISTEQEKMLNIQQQTSYDGLIYYPHPETKPEHFQPSNSLEVLAPKLSNVQYGDRFMLTVESQLIEFFKP